MVETTIIPPEHQTPGQVVTGESESGHSANTGSIVSTTCGLSSERSALRAQPLELRNAGRRGCECQKQHVAAPHWQDPATLGPFPERQRSPHTHDRHHAPTAETARPALAVVTTGETRRSGHAEGQRSARKVTMRRGCCSAAPLQCRFSSRNRQVATSTAIQAAGTSRVSGQPGDQGAADREHACDKAFKRWSWERCQPISGSTQVYAERDTDECRAALLRDRDLTEQRSTAKSAARRRIPESGKEEGTPLPDGDATTTVTWCPRIAVPRLLVSRYSRDPPFAFFVRPAWLRGSASARTCPRRIERHTGPAEGRS